jgi:transposase
MSTSLMYHAFGGKTYKYKNTEYRNGAVYFHLEKKDKHRCCTECRSRDIAFDDNVASTVKTVPIGGKEVFLVLHLKVLKCRKCGARRQESRDVAEARKSYTKILARYVLDLVRHMTILAVASHLKIGWDLVKSILKTDLQKKAERRSWRKVRRIAIDEIAIRKGHNYMTVVLDLDTGWVLYAAEGKDQESLKPFFLRLRRSRAKLEAVVVDMSEAYASAIQEYWPKKISVVHDHYHLVSNMNGVIDKVRRDEQNRIEGEGKNLIKGSRYLLLYARETLAEKKPEKLSRLNALLAVNETLHKVYLLKEDLRLFWSHDSKKEARTFIEQWIEEARAIDNRHVSTFANTIESHLDNILAWYDHPITTGPLEGINNKIKVLKRMAYGYRDLEFFALRLLFLHETNFRLTGS